MAFIDKKNPVVLNIKLTSKGRELLSKGSLTFKYFAIGDSEIDYEFNTNANFNPFNSRILRPADKNPQLLSFITKELSGDSHNAITNIPSTPTIIQNTATPLGFFGITTGSTEFLTDTDHLKQPDAMIVVSGVTGGTRLELYQAPTYLANVNEPAIGDYVLVKWTNPLSESTTGYTVNSTYPTPFLMYRIDEIVSGTLANNNLVVNVDRNLPDFSNMTGGSTNVFAGALVFYNYINFTGSSSNIYENYAVEYLNDSIIAFLQNSQSTTEIFPFWSMSIIYTEGIAGTQATDRSYIDFKSNIYAGFVSYIQNQAPIYKKLGVIHYTNTSPSNTYGEELFQNTPVLHLPTIMWHKCAQTKMGVSFYARGNVKYLTGQTKSLNTTYYDLADISGNIVGKIFNDLKLFVIEDQELLFAMSYKANRSWTLPDYTVGINDNVVIGCLTSEIDFQISGTNLSYIGAADGTLTVYDIVNYVGQMILQVSGSTVGQAYLGYITGDTVLYNLSGDTYNIRIFDTEAINTPTGKTITITAGNVEPSYVFNIYDTNTSVNGLNPNFTLVYTNSQRTQIRIDKNGIGTYYGTGTTTPAVGFGVYGTSPASITNWVAFGVNDSVTISLPNYTGSFTIYVRDVIDYGPVTGTFYVSKNVVAVGSPLSSSFVAGQDIDDGGDFLLISNYLTTIIDSTNRIVGDIEITAYPASVSSMTLPPVWQTATGTQGSTQKLYITPTAYTLYTVAVREVKLQSDGKKVEVAKVTRNIYVEPL